MRAKRHLAWVAAALAFGAVLLPFLVYYTGTLTLGAYAHGGPLQFVADLYGDLLQGRAGAWILLLGPATLVIVWRLLVAYAWPRSGD